VSSKASSNNIFSYDVTNEASINHRVSAKRFDDSDCRLILRRKAMSKLQGASMFLNLQLSENLRGNASPFPEQSDIPRPVRINKPSRKKQTSSEKVFQPHHSSAHRTALRQ
jgi:hypothetical protein